MVWIRRIGNSNEVARALAIDKDGNLWIGMYNTMRLYKMNPTTGATLGVWGVGHRPYGASVDSQNRLFTVVLGHGTASRISVANPNVQTSFPVYDGYGIAIGRDNNDTEVVVTAINSHYGFQLLNPDTLLRSFPIAGSGVGSRGVSIDANGDILLSGANGGWQRNGVTKARTDGSIIWSRGSDTASGCAGGDQRGAIIDADNDIWIVAMNNDAMCKYSAAGTFITKVPVGRRPYTYSDASGIGLQFSDPTGKVTFISDANNTNYDWAGSSLCFSGGGNVTVAVAAADTEAGLQFANPASMALTEIDGRLCGTVPAGVQGQFLGLTFTIKTGGTVVVATDDAGNCTTDIPTGNEPPIAQCIAALTLSANGQCLAAAPSIDNGSNDPDGAADIASLLQTPAAGGSLGLGAHTLGLSIADLAGESATCHTVVTVVDDTPPTADAGADQTGLVADAQCSVAASSVGTGSDNCAVASTTWTDAAGNVVGDTTTFSGSFSALGAYTYGLTVCDNAGACTSDAVTFTVVDTTAPINLSCGLDAAGYTPKSWGDGAITITGSAADNCDAAASLTISGYSVTKKGKDKTGEATTTWNGGALTVGDSVGVDATHSWTLTATDASGNATSIDCSLTVNNPGQGGGSACNNGFGNGSEGCSPDNGAHHDQDETGAADGKGNGKGKGK